MTPDELAALKRDTRRMVGALLRNELRQQGREDLVERVREDAWTFDAIGDGTSILVLWDDGTWQDAADGEFGADKIVVRSAMTEVG